MVNCYLLSPPPPEFPVWTEDAADESSSGSPDVSSSSLINTFLNINPETGASNISLEMPVDRALNVGNIDEHDNDTSGGSTQSVHPQGHESVINSRNNPTPETGLIVFPNNNECDDLNMGNDVPVILSVSGTSPMQLDRNLCTPIMLKENCIHMISRHSQVTGSSPQNLVALCVDVMAWKPDICYRCNMKLPCSMHTKTLELLICKVSHNDHVFGQP